MSQVTTDEVSGSVQAEPEVRRTYHVRHPRLVAAVTSRATALQTRTAPPNRVPGAVATLARLRHAAGKPVGAVADVWEDTVGLVPPELTGRGDEPNTFEQAAHHAMTLFALHRQGATAIAHRNDVPFGHALIRLARARSSDRTEAESVRRRFDALLTSTTPDEAARHLRGIVTLLKSEDIALDYGLLAGDLVDLWTPGRADAVRLRWARDYRRDRTAAPAGSTASDANAAADNTGAPKADE